MKAVAEVIQLTPDTIKKLEDGDIIRNIGSGHAYTVQCNYMGVVVAIRSVLVHNSSEWVKITFKENRYDS